MKLDTKTASIGAGVLVASIMGYVILLALHSDASDARSIFLFCIPVVQLLFTNSAVKPIQDSTAQLEKNTNGVLSAKVGEMAEAAANKAIASYTNQPTTNLVSPAAVVEASKTAAKPTRRRTTAKKKESDNG